MTNAEWESVVSMKLDAWIPANGNSEVEFVSRSGIRMLYCFNPSTGDHAYINCGTDMVMSDEDSAAALLL